MIETIGFGCVKTFGNPDANDANCRADRRKDVYGRYYSVTSNFATLNHSQR